ncbi:PREDICTED: osteocalcin isoform X1 [Ficedula albicollis]|nr:PREDICTED: osteocalcin isoform X1 [Ficedula albicollis]
MWSVGCGIWGMGHGVGGCNREIESRTRWVSVRGLSSRRTGVGAEPTRAPLSPPPLLSLPAADGSPGTGDSPSSEAFVSRRASAEVVQRQKRNPGYASGVPAAPPDPLEAKREVCELSPDCDELADQIGFQEAYRRYYGLV